MKQLIIVISTTLVILLGLIGYVFYLNNVTDNFMLHVKVISHSSAEGNWENSREHAEQLQRKWKKQKNILAAFTDHGDLDEIERGICELYESVAHENPENTARFASLLQILVDRLKENEYPSWENVLQKEPSRGL